MENEEYSVLKLYASTTDKVDMKLLYEHIVHLAKEKELSGVTVYRGIMGFGLSSKKINTSRFWELTEKLPVVIEIIDKTSILNNFYTEIEPDLEKMAKGCLVYMHPIDIRLLKEGKK